MLTEPMKTLKERIVMPEIPTSGAPLWEDELHPTHILIVDDDESFGNMLKRVITWFTGSDCSFARDAAHALKILEERAVDVVITDIKMPDLNGLELTRIIKEKYDSDIIVITGFYEDFTYEEAIKNGANDFIEKPVRPTELIIRLKRVLRERAIDYKRKESEDELRRMNRNLEQLVQERNAELTNTIALLRKELAAHEKTEEALSRVNKELESFSHSISHDLSAYLRVIDGSFRVLRQDLHDRLDEEERSKFDVILDKTGMMNQMIDALLAFTQLGSQELSMTVIDMEKLATDVCNELRVLHGDRDIIMNITHLPAGYGDGNVIRQVLANLIANAVKFTSSKQTAVIEAGGHEAADACVYYVKDNGIGFDTLSHDKLFGIFERLHDEGDSAGTGVGLSLVKRIIERHGGRVWAEGEVGKGATFYFMLPRKGEKKQ